MGVVGQLQRALAHEIRTIRGTLYRRLYASRAEEAATVDAFHKLYFDARSFNMTWRNTFWLGHPILKCPLDMWVYQEIIHEIRPDLIIETGTAFGGSALYLASICDMVGSGRIVTIDIEARASLPQHPRIEYLVGSSVSDGMVAQVKNRVAAARTVMVILDSDHAMPHVASELERLSPFVTRGSYLIVEDTNLNGHPVEPEHGPGPMEALGQFLPAHREFEVDASREKFFLSFNPKGYLKRVG